MWLKSYVILEVLCSCLQSVVKREGYFFLSPDRKTDKGETFKQDYLYGFENWHFTEDTTSI